MRNADVLLLPKGKQTLLTGGSQGAGWGVGTRVVVGKSPVFLAASAWSGVPTFLSWEWGVR